MEAEENYRKPKSLHLAYKPVEYTAEVLTSKLQPSVTATENALGVTQSELYSCRAWGRISRKTFPFPMRDGVLTKQLI